MKKQSPQKEKLRRLTTAGVLTAAAMILSWIEFVLPVSIGIPGVKLGLCHIVTMLAVYRLSRWEAVAVTVVRIGLSAALFGNVASLAYSAAGGAASLLVLFLLQRAGRGERRLFSPLGVSIGGAVTHNLAQVAVAACLMQTAGVLLYWPILLLAGVVTGAAVGAASAILLGRLSGIG